MLATSHLVHVSPRHSSLPLAWLNSGQRDATLRQQGAEGWLAAATATIMVGEMVVVCGSTVPLPALCEMKWTERGGDRISASSGRVCQACDSASVPLVLVGRQPG